MTHFHVTKHAFKSASYILSQHFIVIVHNYIYSFSISTLVHTVPNATYKHPAYYNIVHNICSPIARYQNDLLGEGKWLARHPFTNLT